MSSPYQADEGMTHAEADELVGHVIAARNGCLLMAAINGLGAWVLAATPGAIGVDIIATVLLVAAAAQCQAMRPFGPRLAIGVTTVQTMLLVVTDYHTTALAGLLIAYVWIRGLRAAKQIAARLDAVKLHSPVQEG